jgi:hypothetical protein
MKPFKLQRRRSSGIVINVPSGGWEQTVFDPANAFVSVQFNPDGSTAVSAGASPSSAAAWRVGGGSGADYQISFDAGGSWHSLSVARQISASRGTVGSTENTFNVHIRLAAGGEVLDTGVLVLSATVDSLD